MYMGDKSMKLQELKGRYLIGIPKDLIKAKKWDKGKDLLVAFNERGNIEIREFD